MSIDPSTSMNKYDYSLLKGKVCIIVGAASLRSIGYATAELFAFHGAKLALLDLAMNEDISKTVVDSLALQIGFNPEVLTVQCDIRNVLECEEAIEKVFVKFGRIDCLVNCAGIVKSGGMLSILEEEYDTVLDVNLKGNFNICKSVLKIFNDQGTGVIVNVASMAAQRGGGLVGSSHYAASKGGVISLTRSIAREFGNKGIRANVICPSMTETGMLDGNITKEKFEEVVAAIPLKRAGRPVDIAGVCLFLASDLSAYVTGATIDVNGGSHIH
jgi:NAD(P)-dependent dehydrogenase (short-subunit alcohol dehydrogenase family)